MKKHTAMAWISLAFLSLALAAFPATSTAAVKKLDVLCTTFPMYLITRNVTQGSDAVRVDLMIPADLGCPHDYALTPQDMQKLSRADVLIINGLGLEEFLGAPLERANHKIKVVDSSSGIQEILQYAEEEQHADRHDDAHHDAHAGANPHLFASPRMAARLALNIGTALAGIDPGGAATYLQNAQTYADKMNQLAADFVALGRRLKNDRIVTQHGVFDYLARDMGLEVVAVVEEHGGQEPSAAQMLAIVQTIKARDAGALFTEPQYPAKVGRTIARETGIPAASLDPAASGPQNAPLNYYEIVMRKNIETLEKTLGTRQP
jgi:zinc transport system substrate-binding protein